MATTILLGKDTTVTGLSNVQDVSITIETEKVDATTKGSTGVYKRTKAGLKSRTLEATVLGDASQAYGGGVSVSVTVTGGTAFSMSGVITSVKRTQPVGGAEACTVTIKPGTSYDTVDI